MGNYAKFYVPLDTKLYDKNSGGNEQEILFQSYNEKKIGSLIKKNKECVFTHNVYDYKGNLIETSQSILVKPISLSISYCGLKKINFEACFMNYESFEKAILRENKHHDNFFDTEQGLEMLAEVEKAFIAYPKGFIMCS